MQKDVFRVSVSIVGYKIGRMVMTLHKNILSMTGVVLFSFSLIGLRASDYDSSVYGGGHTLSKKVGSRVDAASRSKSPVDLKFHPSVKISYKRPFNGTIKIVHEQLLEQHLTQEYMVEINPQKGAPAKNNYIIVDGKTYYLVQFHLHAPSEHTINGHRESGEIHFVHKSIDGNIAVLGAFIVEGKVQNKAYKSLLRAFPSVYKDMPKHEGEGTPLALKRPVDVAKLLPLKRHLYAYRYFGSKTSGDLAPGVKWIILTSPIELSAKQLKLLDPIESTGTRIHELYGRVVTIEQVSYLH